MSPRERLTWPKIVRFVSLPFCSERLETLFVVQRFEDIPSTKLINMGIQAVLLDADGTLGPNHTRTFSESKVHHVRYLKEAGLQVGIFTNADENRFEQFEGVCVAKNVPAKPCTIGFLEAMRQTLGMDDPSQVCMIGDNYITDGGAVDAGMKFIYVETIKGNESLIHRLFKAWGFFWARFHGKLVRLEKTSVGSMALDV